MAPGFRRTLIFLLLAAFVAGGIAVPGAQARSRRTSRARGPYAVSAQSALLMELGAPAMCEGKALRDVLLLSK